MVRVLTAILLWVGFVAAQAPAPAPVHVCVTAPQRNPDLAGDMVKQLRNYSSKNAIPVEAAVLQAKNASGPQQLCEFVVHVQESAYPVGGVESAPDISASAPRSGSPLVTSGPDSGVPDTPILSWELKKAGQRARVAHGMVPLTARSRGKGGYVDPVYRAAADISKRIAAEVAKTKTP
jgi:hypothetical protein